MIIITKNWEKLKSKILQQISHSCSVKTVAPSCLKWYLIDRNQSICIGQHLSLVVPCSQGSVLGPLLFTIYTSSIIATAQSHHVQQQQYVDDTHTPPDPALQLADSQIHQVLSGLATSLVYRTVWLWTVTSHMPFSSAQLRRQHSPLPTLLVQPLH